MTDEDELLTAPEAAAVVKFKVTTLAVWRCEGKGPAYLKVNRSVRYRRSDLMAWVNGSDQVRQQIEETAECHADKRDRTKRPIGRNAVNNRDRRLAVEPYCRDCASKGLRQLAEEIDHIVPLADGGTDDDENVRSLCKSCHKSRTRERFFKNAPPLPLYL